MRARRARHHTERQQEPLKLPNLLEGKEEVIDLRNVTGAQPEKGESHSETASGHKSSRKNATSGDISARRNSHVKARDGPSAATESGECA